MKNLKIIGLILITIHLFSCQKKNVPMDKKPEILTATYEILTKGELERGYNVFVETNKLPENVEIKQIVLKKKLFDVIHLVNAETENSSVEGYLPLHSQLIQNFVPPKTDDRADGIVFEIDGKEYFYEIKFELK